MRKKIIIGCLVVIGVIALYCFGWPYVDFFRRQNALQKYDVQKKWKDDSLEYEDIKYYFRVVMTAEEWETFRKEAIKGSWRKETVTEGTRNIINKEVATVIDRHT